MKERKALYTLVEITGTIDYFTQAYLKNYPDRFFCLILDYLWSLHLRGKNVFRKSPFLSWVQRSISHIANHWLTSFLDVKNALKLFEGRACDLINTSTSSTLVLNIGLEIFMEQCQFKIRINTDSK